MPINVSFNNDEQSPIKLHDLNAGGADFFSVKH